MRKLSSGGSRLTLGLDCAAILCMAWLAQVEGVLRVAGFVAFLIALPLAAIALFVIERRRRRASSAYLDRIARDWWGLQRLPGESDESLRLRARRMMGVE